MRWSLLPVVLAAGVAARDLRARDGQVGDFTERKFRTIPYDQAMASLSALAKATPSAVSFIAGAPLSLGSDGNVLNDITEGTPIKDHTIGPQAIPSNTKRQSSSCSNPAVRVEWDNASDDQKTAFVQAIQCLQTKPSRSGLQGPQNRWDDLAAIHQGLNLVIHGVGQFVPWHRYFVWILQQELSNACGYTGPMIWWDETKNSGNFQGADLLTSSYFGTAPDGNAQCITNGEFGNDEMHIGPGSSDTDHCLSRGVDESLTAQTGSSYVSGCQSYNDYNDMQNCVDYGPHAYGHNGMGGVMGDVQSSPQDPIFFMHHMFVDHIWRIWQVADPSSRTYAIGGDTTQNCGSDCTPTTLSYVLSSYGFYQNVTVQDVMDTEGGFLCYHYDY